MPGGDSAVSCRFETAEITAASRVVGGLSTLTVRLRANAEIRSFIADVNLPGASSHSAEPQASLRLGGLVGSMTPSGELGVRGVCARVFAGGRGRWNQTRGELVLLLAEGAGAASLVMHTETRAHA